MEDKLRDYQHIELYLNLLLGDIYPQPPCEGHQKAIVSCIDEWFSRFTNLNSVLDVGCGQGQAIPELKRYAKEVVGVTLGGDVKICQEKGLDVRQQDMSFLLFSDKSFDLIWARHVIEHSPMPLLTLMEWHRVAKQWLCLIVPNPEHYGASGRNHYYVLPPAHWVNLLNTSGWHVIWDKYDKDVKEYRFMCEKKRYEDVYNKKE